MGEYTIYSFYFFKETKKKKKNSELYENAIYYCVIFKKILNECNIS